MVLLKLLENYLLTVELKLEWSVVFILKLWFSKVRFLVGVFKRDLLPEIIELRGDCGNEKYFWRNVVLKIVQKYWAIIIIDEVIVFWLFMVWIRFCSENKKSSWRRIMFKNVLKCWSITIFDEVINILIYIVNFWQKQAGHCWADTSAELRSSRERLKMQTLVPPA